MFIEYWIEQYGINSLENYKHWGLVRFLADIIKNSSNPVAACTVDGKLIAYNTAFKDLTGYSPGELKELNWLDLMPPEHSLDYYFPANQSPEYFNSTRAEHHLVCNDGTALPISYLIQAMRFPGDESTCYMVFITDISEQLRLKESLRYQMAFEELLGRISTRFINLTTSDIDNEIERTLKYIGEFVKADRTYVFWFYERRKIMSNIYEWCGPGIESHKDDLQEVPLESFAGIRQQLNQCDYLHIPSVAEMGPETETEKRLLSEHGIKSLLVVPITYRNKVAGFLGFDQIKKPATWRDRDITLLKIVAEIFIYALERKRSARQMDMVIKILDSISEGMMTLNSDKITWVNEAFTALTGYGYDEVVEYAYSDRTLAEIEPELSDEINESLRRTYTWRGVITARHKQGYLFPAMVFISTINNQPDRHSYFVIFADITEQRRLSDEKRRLANQTMQLQRLNSLSALSAGLVHEIAQPLNSIKVLVEGMLYCRNNYYPLSKAEIFAKLGDISIDLGRIDEIIQHVRSFANLSNKPELEPCNWNQVVARALKMLGRQLAAHGINVVTNLSEDLPIMRGNLNRLDEVMVNLLVNAMQSLDLSDKEDKTVLCRTFTSGSWCCLEITDNGSGIEPELIDEIFEPFITTKTSYQGMGLGLSVVQSIIGALGGQVKAFNNSRCGATFRLELPAIG